MENIRNDNTAALEKLGLTPGDLQPATAEENGLDTFDAVLNLYINVARGLRFYPAVSEKHLREELPFMASENILMFCVREKGGDRQTLHEHIRQHSMRAAEQVKLYGLKNDLLDRILADEAFGLTEEELKRLLDPTAFTGMAEAQCRSFLREQVAPVLDADRNILNASAEIKV